MKSTQKITFHADTREKLRKGVNTLAEVVSSTLGPSGHSVILNQDSTGLLQATKDGVTVAKNIKLDDPEENVGAQMLKQASIKTADEAGDGTTTATVLARAMYNWGLDYGLKGQHYNSVAVKKGMESALNDVIEEIQDISKPVTETSYLDYVARISANGDKEVGNLVSAALNEVGQEGAVTIEESKTGESYLDTVEGIQFKQGWKSPYFVTDNESMTAVLEDVCILFADQKLTNIKELLPMLNAVAASNKSLLIVAEDIGGEVLSTLVVNKIRAGLKVVAVKAPDFGDRRKAILEDMAILTGGTVVDKDKGMRIDKFNTEWFGTANKVVVGQDETTIIGATGPEENIQARIEQLKKQIDETSSAYEKEVLQGRLARFAGGVAVLYVGGHTDVELAEKKDRVDDALHATRAALEEGICPGGGRALMYAAEKVYKETENETYNADVLLGRKIVLEACTVPFKTILGNVGIEKERIEELYRDVASQGDPWVSLNVETEEQVDMLKAGVIDPTKVVRLSLRNAVSVASTMLTSEAMVVTVDQEPDAPADMY